MAKKQFSTLSQTLKETLISIANINTVSLFSITRVLNSSCFIAIIIIGLISDPMAVHRSTKTAHSWSDEEKAIFKEKFVICNNYFKIIL